MIMVLLKVNLISFLSLLLNVNEKLRTFGISKSDDGLSLLDFANFFHIATPGISFALKVNDNIMLCCTARQPGY